MIKAPLVALTFLDHCFDNGEDIRPIECTVMGALYKEDKDAYYVVSWVAGNNPSDSNSDCYAILKSTVKAVYQWKPVKVKKCRPSR